MKNIGYNVIRQTKGFSLSFLIILFFISACTSHKVSTYPDSTSARKIKEDTDSHGIEKMIRNEFKHWKGKQHRLGGTDHGGIDCSGFVKEVYKKLFNIELPRTAKDQAKKGIPIGWDELQPGDLVFFKPPTYPHHVGIYLSGDEFVHASKSKGVTISHIDPYYWGQYYWTARRIPLY